MHLFYDNLKVTDLVYFVTDENIKRLRSPSFSSVLKELQNWSPPPRATPLVICTLNMQKKEITLAEVLV
jgi:hypothetical protein